MKNIETEEKYLIWSNTDLDINDYRESFEEFIEMNDLDFDKNDEDALYKYMVDLNDDFLNNEKMELGNIVYNQPIIVLGDIGLWNRRVSGYKYITSGKVSDCLATECDYAKWYVDGHGDMRSIEYHHDGTNYSLYRVLKEDIHDEELEQFEDAIYEGNVSDADIEKYTEKIGNDIAKFYGWEIAGLKKEQETEKDR